MLHVDDLIDEMRSLYLNDPAGTIYRNEGDLLNAINAFQRQEMYQKARMASEQVNSVSTTLAYADFTEVHPRRWRARLGPLQANVTDLYRTDTSEYQDILEKDQPARQTSLGWDPDQDRQMAADLRYELRGRDLFLHGSISAGFTCEFWWEQVPPDLFKGIVATGSTATSIIVQEVASTDVTGRLKRVPGFYQGAFLVLLTATDSSNLGVPVLIQNSTGGATITFTVDALPATPTAGDTFSLISPFPPEYHSLLAEGAALQLAKRNQNRKLIEILLSSVAPKLRDFVFSIESRQTNASRHVRETDTTEFQ